MVTNRGNWRKDRWAGPGKVSPGHLEVQVSLRQFNKEYKQIKSVSSGWPGIIVDSRLMTTFKTWLV